MNIQYHNNTVFIARSVPNSYGLYADLTCSGPRSLGSQRIELLNNIFDGASNYSVFVSSGFSSISEDYNNIGGMQGNPGFKLDDSVKGRHDLLNVDPHYVNAVTHDYRLQPGSPCIHAGLPVPGRGLSNVGAY
jgi:hypothetical protein